MNTLACRRKPQNHAAAAISTQKHRSKKGLATTTRRITQNLVAETILDIQRKSCSDTLSHGFVSGNQHADLEKPKVNGIKTSQIRN